MNMLDDTDTSSSLKRQFDTVVCEVEKIENSSEPTTSSVVQDKVKRNITTLEHLTRAVSELALFSENEDVSEVPTHTLRFLLLPALLGYLTGKVTGDSRLEFLQLEQIYYRDFLNRLRSYNIIKSDDGDEPRQGGDTTSFAAPLRNVLEQSRNRQKKIERYKEQRSLQEKLEAMRQRANSGISIDDELARDLYITELKVWAGKAFDAIETVQQEIELLRARSGIDDVDSTTSTSKDAGRKIAPSLTPFIITRTEIQKAVYGLGYPSIPTMSLEEFFEQKRREGQVQALSGSAAEKQGPTSEEDERIQREQQYERDDPEVLNHDREYDDYKDDHRRGWGSVHNKG